jgi:hypothetical protein
MILFSTTSEDDPRKAYEHLVKRIVEIRTGEVNRLHRLAEAVEALMANREQESAEADLCEVVRHLQTVVEQIRTLGASVRPFFDALLRQIADRATHQKSLVRFGHLAIVISPGIPHRIGLFGSVSNQL